MQGRLVRLFGQGSVHGRVVTRLYALLAISDGVLLWDDSLQRSRSVKG